MTGETADGLQNDDELEATAEEAARTYTDSRFKDLNTSMPGIVQSFDATTQTAQVQPALQRLFVDGNWVNLPPCVDVPVQWPAGGPFVLTFPVVEGDEGILLFSQRAIDFWWDRGGVQQPSEYRLHDLSDACFIPGISSKPRALSGVASDAAELRTRDGTTVLRVEAGKIILNADAVFLGSATGTEPATLGQTLAGILTIIQTHTHLFTGAVSGGSCSGTATASPDLVSMDPNSVKASKANVI